MSDFPDQNFRLPSPVPCLPPPSNSLANDVKRKRKKRQFKKIVFDVNPTEELEEGEIVSDNEGDDIIESRPSKSSGKRVVTYKAKPRPVRQRLGINPNKDSLTSGSGSRDEENGDDKSGFMSDIAQLKADLSELLFTKPNQTMPVSTISSAYRFSFNRSLPVDYSYSTEDLLFSLNLFSLKLEGVQKVVKWDKGKFLANFKENAEDLLQAKECIPLDQFLPLYLKIFGHNVTEEAFLEMCGYPCTSELLTACCPSIRIPKFNHQMLRMYNTVDYSGYSTVDYEYGYSTVDYEYEEYDGRKICTFFRSGWCKFGQLCFNIH